MERIDTDRLFLRPVNLDDAASMYGYRSDAAENRYQGWIPQSVEEVCEFIRTKTAVQINTPDTWFQFAILLKETDRLIGDIGVHFVGADGVKAEVGCTLDKHFQGQGYAAEAVASVLDYLVRRLGKHRVVASVDPRNLKSIGLLERLGFRKESYFPKRFMLRGEWVDDVIYALSAEEWISRNCLTQPHQV